MTELRDGTASRAGDSLCRSRRIKTSTRLRIGSRSSVALSRRSQPTCPGGDAYSGCRTQMDLGLRSHRPCGLTPPLSKADAGRLSGKALDRASGLKIAD